jgi:hypothetical protein
VSMMGTLWKSSTSSSMLKLSVKPMASSLTPEVFDDTYLDMGVALPHGEPGPEFARVTKRLQDANGLPIGIANENPILDTPHLYEVEHADGVKSSMTANLIAQNMFAQVNEDSHHHVPFQEIVDYWSSDQAIKQADAFIATQCGTKQQRETTQGWNVEPVSSMGGWQHHSYGTEGYEEFLSHSNG